MTYPGSTISIAAFLKRRWEHCRKWPRETILSWVQWHVNHGRCLVVTKGGKIGTVVCYRQVDAKEQAQEHYKDTTGPLVYIEVCASRLPLGIKAAYDLLLGQCGKLVTHVCWVRGKYRNRFSIFNINDATRHLTYG
jgi:hypothetical protein